MVAFWNIIRHKYLGVSATVAMLLLLPIIVVATQRPTVTTGIAEGTSIVSFSPLTSAESPIEVRAGDSFFINVLLDPEDNIISLVKLDVSYDPEKLKFDNTNPVNINENIFPDILDGPNYGTDSMEVTLSVGSDLSNALSTRTRVVTLNFTALESITDTETLIRFGTENMASPVEINDLSGENVLSTTSPAHIKIE
jgi:hypothetical protein